VIERLQYDQEIRAEKIDQPLLQLFTALHDLCAGGKPALLCHVARPDGVKTKPKIASAHLAQGVLVVAYMALERVKWKPAKAKDWLNDELRARNLHDLVCGEDITAGTAIRHRQKLAPTVVKTIRDYEAELPGLQDETGALALARSASTQCMTWDWNA
jgi:hypothetical protein